MSKIGKIYPAKTLFFRQSVGTCKDSRGDKYELSLNVGGSVPIIKNERTGLWYTLSWSDIVNLARKAGIDGKKVA